MDTSKWSIPQLLQLPDEYFGRRFPIFLQAEKEQEGSLWDIAEIALPDICILWHVNILCQRIITSDDYFRLALGDQLPTTTAMMDALEPLLPGLGDQGAEPRHIILPYLHQSLNFPCRVPLATAGRRPILEVTEVAANKIRVTVVLVVSSLRISLPSANPWEIQRLLDDLSIPHATGDGY